MDFEYGDCPIFAIALHRLTGLPLHALVEFDESLETTVLIHAFVRKDSNTLIDYTGETTLEYITDKYPNWGEVEEIRISEDDLLGLGYSNNAPPLEQVLLIAQDVLDSISITVESFSP